jgi:predicted nucleic acid-binding protein
VSLLVDTSVWSLALRRDGVLTSPEVVALRAALEAGETVVTTGVVLQELLQGFGGPKARQQIVERFAALPLLSPDRRDHIEAADLRNRR